MLPAEIVGISLCSIVRVREWMPEGAVTPFSSRKIENILNGSAVESLRTSAVNAGGPTMPISRPSTSTTAGKG